jgi:hypothetical protein
MQDVCEVDMDIISEYMEKENHEELINQIIGIVETIENIITTNREFFDGPMNYHVTFNNSTMTNSEFFR